MRYTDEKQYALECLQLAGGDIPTAEQMLAFVMGTDTDDAKTKLEAVREAVK